MNREKLLELIGFRKSRRDYFDCIAGMFGWM